jgi:Ubiquitin-2 like Rad60 SUMO-like
VSATGEEVFFKIKRSTKLSKLQGAYANKVGKDVGSIRCVLFCVLLFVFLYSSMVTSVGRVFFR